MNKRLFQNSIFLRPLLVKRSQYFEIISEEKSTKAVNFKLSTINTNMEIKFKPLFKTLIFILLYKQFNLVWKIRWDF
ncbi:hypothetical protein BpHYR1_044837 [Brachionus plicatilis]|uniref:Uncharacterized protein n=1 Tax=Brachionus plicatilis TaxID=10195 RepID=A0A3M7RB23_BRAPC|nr:hypothetical protein BpHYR1_044837 [Brachionus plicatilis]